MEKREIIAVLTELGSNYDFFAKKMEDKNKFNILANTWYECLKDLAFNDVMKACREFMLESRSEPTIHDIRSRAIPKDSIDTIEYWQEAYKMISNGYYMTQEEYETHSDIVKKFFGSVNQVKALSQVDIDTINTVTKGQFLKQIDILQQSKRKNELLPISIKSKLNTIGIESIGNI